MGNLLTIRLLNALYKQIIYVQHIHHMHDLGFFLLIYFIFYKFLIILLIKVHEHTLIEVL